MSKPSQKKIRERKAKDKARKAKDKARERRKEETRKVQEHKRLVAKGRRIWADRYRAKYPEFLYYVNNAPREFVDLFHTAFDTIDFEDVNTYGRELPAFLRRIKRLGAKRVLDDLDETESLQRILALGNTFFSRIPKDKLLKYIPVCDFQTIPIENHIKVIFRALNTAEGRSKKKPIYYSKHEPKLEIDGQQKIVGFSKHVIRERCDRYAPGWDTYGGLGDAFAKTAQCVYFERIDLPNGQKAFTFYDECAIGFFESLYAREILGEEVKEGGLYYYRVGYAPISIWRDFIVGRTILFPGQRNTPERVLIESSNLPIADKEQMIEQAEAQDAEYIMQSCDFSLLKWFHNNGVPQVIKTDRRLYEPV